MCAKPTCTIEEARGYMMGRQARLDKTTVVQAAAALVNREGIAALSLQRLATALGIQTPSLYNHIDGLPGLQQALAVMNARALADCLSDAAIGKAGTAALQSMAEAYRSYIKAAPGVYMITLRSSGTQPTGDPELEREEARTLRVVLAVLASLGIEGADAIHAARALRSVIHGFATLEIAGGFGLPLDCDESFRRLLNLLVEGLQKSTNDVP